MPTDHTIYLQDILECIDLIELYTQNLSKSAFLASREKQDAVIRRLEIIGEATRHLPTEITVDDQEIPWPRIIAMRNRLIHAYGQVDLELTCAVVERELPQLKSRVRSLLKQHRY